MSGGLSVALQSLLGDVVTLYFRAKGHHWNVEGADFYEYHEFFDDIASDIYGSIDPMAENIRKLGDYAPFRLERFIDDRNLDTSSRTTTDGKSLVKDLLEANEFFIGQLKSVFDIATSENEQGIANFIADRIDMHQKWSWQLRSTGK